MATRDRVTQIIESRRGRAARGFVDRRTVARKMVAVRFRLDQFDEINQRVVRNNSTFAAEVRKLVDEALGIKWCSWCRGYHGGVCDRLISGGQFD